MEWTKNMMSAENLRKPSQPRHGDAEESCTGRPERGRDQIGEGRGTHESEGRWLGDLCAFGKTVLAAAWVEKDQE